MTGKLEVGVALRFALLSVANAIAIQERLVRAHKVRTKALRRKLAEELDRLREVLEAADF